MGSAVAVPTRSQRRTDHRFYLAVSAGLALVVFVGFAPTYYLKGWFENEPLSLLVHVHGAVMTAWYGLFGIQVGLASTHRVALHKKLGFAGIFLAGAVVVLGTTVSFGLARRRLVAHPESTLGPFLLGLQLFSIVLVFIALIVAGVWLRRRPDYHKRLMTLAMLAVLGPAIVRLPFINDHNIPAAIATSTSLVLLCVGADTWRNRRLHPAFGWGGALVTGSVFVVAPFAHSSVWIGFVRRLLL